MPFATTEQDAQMKEARHALEDGLGRVAERYTLIHVWDGFIVPQGAAVAWSLEDKTIYLLIDDTPREHAPQYLPTFMLDAARDLTMYFRTLVAPAQSSRGQTYWGGKSRGPFVAYRFSLLDSPESLRY